MSAGGPAPEAAVPEITPGEAREHGEAGDTILDVRETHEWIRGHIPGAMHIPLPSLPNRLGELDRPQLRCQVQEFCDGATSNTWRTLLEKNSSAGGRAKEWTMPASRQPQETGHRRPMGFTAVAISMPLIVIGLLLSAVLLPNIPVQIAGVVLMLVACGYLGYAIRVDRDRANTTP